MGTPKAPEPRLTCGKCDHGWICEAHPDRPWPHDDCAGPGIPCDVPTCPYRIDVRPVRPRTGLVCPQCRQPVAMVERVTGGLVMECPHCGNAALAKGFTELPLPGSCRDDRAPSGSSSAISPGAASGLSASIPPTGPPVREAIPSRGRCRLVSSWTYHGPHNARTGNPFR